MVCKDTLVQKDTILDVSIDSSFNFEDRGIMTCYLGVYITCLMFSHRDPLANM
jgi:hypothetical protein